jgi:hypothetical protein
VIDHNRFLVPVVHLAPHLQLLLGVEAVEGRGPFGVLHLDEPNRGVTPHWARDDPARLVWVVGAGVRDDLVV